MNVAIAGVLRLLLKRAAATGRWSAGRARLLDALHRLPLVVSVTLFHLIDSRLAIQTIPNNVVSHDELIELLLQVVVLQGEQIRVVLERVQLLLVAVARFQ